MASQDFPISFRDPLYAALDASTEQRLGLPVGMLSAVRTEGERSNANQVSSDGARTPYQILPATRKAILEQYGLDAYLSPQTASEAAGLLLRDSLNRAGGNEETAVREYHGGTDPKNWGKLNDAYWRRVSAGMHDASVRAMAQDFGRWMASNPATPDQSAAAVPAQDKMVADFRAWADGAGQIPGTALPDRQPAAIGVPLEQMADGGPGILDRMVGAIEGPAAVVLNTIGGAAGAVAGGIAGVSKQIASGQLGNPADRSVENAMAAGTQFLTDPSSTQTGRQIEQAAGRAMEHVMPAAMALPGMATAIPGGVPKSGAPASVLAKAGVEGTARNAADFVAKPAVVVGAVAPGAAGDAAAAAAQGLTDAAAAGAARVASLAKGVTTLPRRAIAALRGTPEEAGVTPGALGSAGAAATDIAAQRRATAADLPVPVDLTKGQATRDPAQLKFEIETAKNPEFGGPLRERTVQQNDAYLRNFDNMIDQTGAQAPDLRAVGNYVVDRTLMPRARLLKREIQRRYDVAEAAGEMEEPVTLEAAIRHINDNEPESAVAPLLTMARNKAIKTGVATASANGELIAQPVPLKTAELFRKAIGQATDFAPTNVRQSTIIKGLIDSATDGMGGRLYKAARAARARYAQEFEDYAVVAKLVDKKKGMADRQVALEDVYKHTILASSLDDVIHLRRVLSQAGPEGAQAWKELQGATLAHIRDVALNSATDSMGNRVLSPAGLDKVVRSLDADGKLDFVLGKQTAQKVRDVRDLALWTKTAPPEAAINTSNTASAMSAAVTDTILSGLSGLPMPVATVTREALKSIHDSKLRARISDALGQAQKPPGTSVH
jgi:hypothetical protein